MSQVDRDEVRAARERLDEWLFEARDRAYTELFEGPDPLLDGDDLRELDRLDSRLSREDGGLWGTDEYGVVAPGTLPGGPRVVCTYHPQIPEYVYRGDRDLEEATYERFNEALWRYCERVADHLEDDLEAFLRAGEE